AHFDHAKKQSACDLASALLKHFHTWFRRRTNAPGRTGLSNNNRSRIQMPKYKLEYLWLDGYEPVANIRGKTTLKEFAKFPKLEELPWWNFDGSSTRQAEGKTSDCMLKPV